MVIRFGRKACALMCVCSFTLYATEGIKNLSVDVHVLPDASLVVHEKILVTSEGRMIRHGIVRDFPTQYRMWFGLRAVVPFQVIEALCDGKPVAHKTVTYMNGVRVYLGDEDTFVSAGMHTYLLTYQVQRILSFHRDYDQLAWNVTGNDSIFPIEQVSASVHLPKGIPAEKVQCMGYTGLYGDTGSAYCVQRSTGNTYVFKTTEVLQPGSGFTLDLAWPKGFISPMSWIGFMLYLIRDNLDLCILIISLLLLVFVYAVVLQRAWRGMPHTTVIPLFYPPRDFMPGAIRYVAKRHFDATCLTSEVANMAVLGYLTIEYKKNLLTRDTYTLIKKENDVTKIAFEYADLYKALFANGDRVVLGDPTSGLVVDSLINRLKLTYAKQCAPQFLQSRFTYMWPALLLSLGSFVIAFFFNFYAFLSLLDIAVVVLHLLVHIVSCALLPAYSYEGQLMKNEIDGFKLFLKTTEKERIKLVGTPPTRTPELFERYLPYAIALGVEKKWAAQFAPLFKSLEAQGTPYTPLWVSGPSPLAWHIFMGRSFTHALHPNIPAANKPISSSKNWPGSSSGFGKGSSGSGGGGGGFGGW